MTKIKVCGLRRKEDIEAVNAYQPDYIGFVFAKSKRQVSVSEAEKLSCLLRPSICPVGVFVNAPVETVCEIVQRGIIRVIQLHGQENERYVRELRERLADPVIIKALRMETGYEPESWKQSEVDYLLLDAGAGGTGRTFDHDLLKESGEITKPWFLAGGMCPENAADAIRRLHPYAIDVSSGVETDGWKDADKIRRMIEAVRNA
ncbi:MAG: phosphoribosylanthranilate isomerase [Clostridiales bacterium]|nr:phosphoribosylanthranilate isomerase [Clostridiales bacterium]